MKTKHLQILPLMILITTLFIGCKKLDKGVVVAKYYEPERIYTTTRFIVVGKTTVPQTVTNFDDEDWYITFEGTVEGEIRSRTISVSEYAYNNHSYGDSIHLSRDILKRRPNR